MTAGATYCSTSSLFAFWGLLIYPVKGARPAWDAIRPPSLQKDELILPPCNSLMRNAKLDLQLASCPGVMASGRYEITFQSKPNQWEMFQSTHATRQSSKRPFLKKPHATQKSRSELKNSALPTASASGESSFTPRWKPKQWEMLHRPPAPKKLSAPSQRTFSHCNTLSRIA